ncbi:MAG: sugar phosphate isomerase/epimerase, partial [Chloroflexi bacterium]|nr:sugar phosphate isomerase/epimerase [Chloroflexota bacterium]
MLLGAAGFFAGDWTSFSAAIAGQAASLGFSTLGLRVQDPRAVSDADVSRTRRLFSEAGMVPGQTVGEYGGALVSPDDAERAAAIDFM